jgi:hypothetical protein
MIYRSYAPKGLLPAVWKPCVTGKPIGLRTQRNEFCQMVNAADHHSPRQFREDRYEANASKNLKSMLNQRSLLWLVVFAMSAVSCTPPALAQTASSRRSASAHADATLPDDLSASQTVAGAAADPSTAVGQQTKRILGIIPNFRSVSVDAKLPSLSPRNKFKLMLQDSFDYSSFIYVGILAGVGQAQNSYPEFHQGAAGYGRYYWHSFADNLSGT